MFKKIIIVLIVLFFLAAAALAVFIATFDADKYRSLIETKATELTGFPVKLGGVSLTWKNGLALEVRDLALKVREEEAAPVTVRSAYVALEVMPLLKGTIQMGSIIVENPEVIVIRAPDGHLRGAAELAEAQPGQSPKGPSGAESTLALLIQNLTIRGGKFIFQDQFGGRVREYTMDQIELHLSDVSLLSPFPVELKAAIFSSKQNVTLAGKVHVRLTKQEVKLQDFVLETNLEDLDVERLSQAFPELRDSGFPATAGQIQAHLSDMTLSERSEPVFNARITLNRGRAAFSDMAAVENIGLESEVTAKGLDLKNLSADWAGGHLSSSSKIDWSKAPLLNGSYQAVLSGLDLTQVVPAPASSRDPGVNGTLSANLSGAFAMSESVSLLNALTGDGQVLVKEGVITNLNVLNEVLGKLSIIPGVSQKIQSRLSEEYLAKLEERDTRLEDVTLPVRIKDGFVFMNSIAIKSDTLQINGQAQAALAGPLNGRLFAAIDPEFSMALIRSVNELQSIADQSGQLTIPITIRGTLQKPEAVPEVQQLASRIVASKAQELISGFLNKNKQPETGTADGTVAQGTQPLGMSGSEPSYQQQNSQTQQQPTDPFAALLGQVLQAATNKEQ